MYLFQVSDNAQLNQLYSTTEDSLTKLEGELSRVKGEVVGQQTLMATISQDKESISRAVAQNKELKEQLAELQEAFVQKSHHNMELATTLESEKYQNQMLTQRQVEVERELTAEKRRFEEIKRELPVSGDKEEEERLEPVGVTHEGIPSTDTTIDTTQLQVHCNRCFLARPAFNAISIYYVVSYVIKCKWVSDKLQWNLSIPDTLGPQKTVLIIYSQWDHNYYTGILISQ